MDQTTSGIIVGILMLILNIVVRKYIDPIMPDKKKAISYIKKFLAFNFKYTFNIVFMIYFFIDLEFNKFFVLIICFYITLITFNIIIDIIFKLSDLSDRIRKLHWETIEMIAKEVDKINRIKN